MAQSKLPPDETSAIVARVEQAREARSHFQSIYNEFFDMAAPWRTRVGTEDATAENPRAPSEQDDIFDATLQEEVDNWTSSANDEFTPSYRPWTKHEPVTAVATQGLKKQVDEFIQKRMDTVYGAIRASSFEEASQEFYTDLAIAPSGLSITMTPAGRPFNVDHIPINELLILPGPHGGVDDRWRERNVKVRHLDRLWPDCDWSDFGGTAHDRKRSKAVARVIVGGYRDWSRGEETWDWYVMANGKVLKHKRLVGAGSCPFVVGRTRVSAPSAYGVGPAGKALPAARTLNQLAYLELKRLGKVVDPPGIYFDDGLLNPEQGFDAGKWYAADRGFSVELLEPKSDMREVYFAQEDLREQVRRALYTDGPFQRGDTPPSATQWLGEEARAERRKSFPRARIQQELVLPAIRRFEHLLRKRGEIDDLEVENTVVRIEPVSPMSRAADMEEARVADDILGMWVGRFGEAAAEDLNVSQTMANSRDKLGDELIVVRSDQEVQQARMAVAAAEAAGTGAA